MQNLTAYMSHILAKLQDVYKYTITVTKTCYTQNTTIRHMLQIYGHIDEDMQQKLNLRMEAQQFHQQL
jgi:uncharacterized protein with HEPN domain